MSEKDLELVLVSGMSGAGRSTAARALEDLGWFVIDNLPPALLPSTVELGTGRAGLDAARRRRRRPRRRPLRRAAVRPHRAARTRRSSRASCSSRRPTRRSSAGSRARAGRTRCRARAACSTASPRSATCCATCAATPTSSSTPARSTSTSCTAKVDAAFGGDDDVQLRATVMSFGFKYGIPVDADLVVDVRFLPNPYWIPELRDHNGLDQAVNDYVVDAARRARSSSTSTPSCCT